MAAELMDPIDEYDFILCFVLFSFCCLFVLMNYLMSDKSAVRRDPTDAVFCFEALEVAVGWPRRREKQGDMQCVITPCETLSVAASSP